MDEGQLFAFRGLMEKSNDERKDCGVLKGERVRMWV
jgi:hypothetical protein